MQRKRVAGNPIVPREKAENEEVFKKLIESIRKNGFDYNNPIIINRNFRIVDGAHRLVTALYFDIPYVSVTMKDFTMDLGSDFSFKWFEQNGMEEIVDDMKKTYERIIRKDL